MLYTETVRAELLEVLNFCMKNQNFEELRLVGGTALALQFGHRDSIDIDLFGTVDLEQNDLFTTFQNVSDDVQIISKQKNINIFIIKTIKVDVVNYEYPWIKPEVISSDIRMAHPEDIAAMKINAIVGRGSKKDFIDLDLLLKQFSLKEILSFYKKKYNQVSEFMALKSLLYFADADIEATPKMHHAFDWEMTKNKIKSEVESYSL